jgi:hypothetical protein
MGINGGETTTGKILLVISLYLTLGLIAFFNFGIYRYLFSHGTNSGRAVHITTQVNINEDTENTSITTE